MHNASVQQNRAHNLRLFTVLCQDCFDVLGQLVRRKRLEQVFFGACLHALLDLVLLALGGKEDDRGMRNFRVRLDLPACIITGHLGHAHVKHSQVGMFLLGQLVTFFSVGTGNNFMPRETQGESDQFPDIWFIFCDDDLGHNYSSLFSTGTVKEKVLPSPGMPLLSIQIFPWCISTSCLTIGRPNPVPGVASTSGSSPRKKRSKTRSCCSIETPIPESFTSTWMAPFSRCREIRMFPSEGV